MFASFRKCLSVVVFASFGTLGCDDGTTPLEEGDTAVRTKTQLALVGEACTDNADCDDPCFTDETCDVGVTDLCIATTPAADGTACDTDGDLCDGETCGTGICGDGTPAPPTCTDPDTNDCVYPVCNSTTGLCTDSANEANNTPCETGNLCFTGDECNPMGVCQEGSTEVTCADPDTNDCVYPVCNTTTGLCTDSADEAQGTACSDGSLCTIGDTCDSAGNCNTFTNTVTCIDADTTDCVYNSCNPATGACTISNNETAGTSCDDGNACTTGDNCNAAGACNQTTGTLSCPDLDANDCVDTSCNPTVGCEDIPKAAATPCDDGNACTNTDTCDAGGNCNQHASTVTCTDPDTNDCVYPTCNTGTGACDVILDETAGTSCSDGNACTLNDTCNAAGVCNQNTGTVSCADPNNADCVFPTCNPASGACDIQVNEPEDELCSDGNACTLNDACDNAGGCTKNTGTITCSDPNSNDCVFPTCNTSTGICNVIVNEAEDTSCSDGNACTQNDACDASGGCTKTTPVSCPDPNPTDCVDRVCNPAVGCQNQNRTTTNPVPGTSYCDDGVGCTESEVCNNGTCQGTTNDNNCANGDCFIGICDSVQDCQPRYDTLAGSICRPEAQGTNCDVAETCPNIGDPNYGTPAGQDCPPDDFEAGGNTVPCSSASCDNGLQTDQVFCSGTGPNCPPANQVPCPGYACTEDLVPVCQFTCVDDADCLRTHYCDTNLGSCVVRIGAGQPCDDDGQCSQGDSCVDGVCCNSECNGQCEACNVPGEEGNCVPVTGAPHPGQAPGVIRPDCTTDGSPCGGTCDGSNRSTCTYPASGTVCAAPNCDPVANEAVEASTCNGSGNCNAPTPSDCSPYVCDGDVCRGDCTQDSHCEGTQQCNGGICVDPFNNGQDCTVGSQCASGLCVDGVCCESTCAGQCEACNVSGDLGSCVPVTGDPVGSRPDCGGSGDCQGTCGGTNRSACTYPSTDTQCRDAACTDGTATLAAYCNGSGSCPAAQDVDCGEGCSGVICADGECSLNADCGAGEVCRAGVCVSADPDGTACAMNSDCESGNCVDGFCCDSTCGGQCEACDVAGSLGVCSPVDAGDAPHGARMQCASDGSACGGSCDGSTRDSCDYPDGDECRAGSCSNGIAVVSAVCNGSGLCPILQQQDCGTVTCDNDNLLCDGPCADDPDACSADEYCSAGVCVELISDGGTCAADSQCDSGFCVDGYCCNSGCDAQCAACDVSGSEGTCSPVEGATHGARPSCEGSGTCGAQCDGEDTTECAFPGANVECGAPTCSGGVETSEPYCNGSGQCGAGTATACPSLVCNGTECAEGCETDEDCQGDLICQDGACVEDPLINAVDKGSCGCRVVGNKSRGSGIPWILIAPLSLLAMRRRRSVAAAVGKDALR